MHAWAAQGDKYKIPIWETIVTFPDQKYTTIIPRKLQLWEFCPTSHMKSHVRMSLFLPVL